MFATGGSVNIAPVSSVERQVEPHLQGLSMLWASYAGDCRHVGARDAMASRRCLFLSVMQFV
jgi:hypothetical protein